MVNSQGFMILMALICMIGLPIAVTMDQLQQREEDDKLAADIMKTISPAVNEPDEQRKVMNMIEGKKMHLYRPKTDHERVQAIADVWSLDLNKPLRIAMRNP